MVRQKRRSVKSRIADFQTTDEKLSSRAGLAPMSRYLEATKIRNILASRDEQ